MASHSEKSEGNMSHKFQTKKKKISYKNANTLYFSSFFFSVSQLFLVSNIGHEFMLQVGNRDLNAFCHAFHKPGRKTTTVTSSV